MFSFSPNTRIKSAEVNQNFTDLSTGTGDATANSLATTRKIITANFVSSGLTIPTSASLTCTIAAGIAIVNGQYISITATARTFTASKDTYVDIKDDGTLVYVEVANGATTGMTLTTNSDGTNALRIAKVVTSATAITTVVQAAFDPINNRIYHNGPVNALQAPDLWWPEIARVTLATAGNSMNTPTFPARKYLKIIISYVATGGNVNGVLQFNGDTGNNYGSGGFNNAAALSTSGSSPNIGFDSGVTASGGPLYATFEGMNVASAEKIFWATGMNTITTGAATAPAFIINSSKWVNTSAQITTAQATNSGGTGTFAAGSELIVLGRN